MNRIAELRKKAGLSQKELGTELNATQGTISNWEKGVTQPNNEILLKMSKLFNASINEILGEKNNSYVYCTELEPDALSAETLVICKFIESLNVKEKFRLFEMLELIYEGRFDSRFKFVSADGKDFDWLRFEDYFYMNHEEEIKEYHDEKEHQIMMHYAELIE